MSSPTSSSDEAARPGRKRPPARPSQPSLTGDVCPYCGGAGYVVPDLPPGHPEFGRPTPCVCRQHERSSRRLRSLQSIGNLEALQRLTFANFTPEPGPLSAEKARSLRLAFENCRNFAVNPDGWLLLSGVYGCGKTHLAAAIANARLDLGEPVVFAIVPDLLDHLRAAFSPHAETSYDDLFEQLRNAPLLILDDLGAHSGTPWAQEKLFQLLNHRYNAQLPTVITTNQRLEDLDPRLRSRLQDQELVNYCPILAPDFRPERQTGQTDLSTLAFHRNQTFATFNAGRNDISVDERNNLRIVVSQCKQFTIDPQGWLMLAGVNGCGKTHLAAAIANEFVEQTRTDVVFVVVPDLLDHLRASFSPQSSVSLDRRFDEIKRAQMLILDDLGIESATPWAREKLFQLLNFRFTAVLPTVITTCIGAEDLDPWLRTRVLDASRCRLVAITAPAFFASRNSMSDKKPYAAKKPKR